MRRAGDALGVGRRSVVCHGPRPAHGLVVVGGRLAGGEQHAVEEVLHAEKLRLVNIAEVRLVGRI